jgi:hypothetical protein
MLYREGHRNSDTGCRDPNGPMAVNQMTPNQSGVHLRFVYLCASALPRMGIDPVRERAIVRKRMATLVLWQ